MNTEVHGMVTGCGIVGAKWRTLYFATFGAFAGYLGSVVLLGADIASAKLVDKIQTPNMAAGLNPGFRMGYAHCARSVHESRFQ